MKMFKFFASIITFSFIVSVCIAQEQTEVRNVKNFTGIKVSESINVELTYGDKEFVEVTADEDYIDRVVTEMNGDKLIIHIKGNSWNSWGKNILVKVTAKQINSIEASSSSSVITQNLIESNKLKIHTSSSAKVKIAFNAPTVTCKASSSSKMNLKGKAKNLDVNVSSSASIYAEELQANKIDANASSSGKIVINAKEELIAHASSSGSIKYKGNPDVVDINTSSSGSVRKTE